MEYQGKIVDISDPKKIGRCKILVYGVYGDEGDLGKIDTKDLPWAYPIHPISFTSTNGGSSYFNTPILDTEVKVIFESNFYTPRYFTQDHLDDYVKEESNKDYEEFHSILFDKKKKLKFFVANKTGLMMQLDSSYLNIKPDNSIVLFHKGNTSMMEFKGSDIDMVTKNSINLSSTNNMTLNSNYVHVNGLQTDIGFNPIFSSCNTEIMMKFMRIVCTALDAKYPPTPGVLTGVLDSMEQLILSKTVSVSP